MSGSSGPGAAVQDRATALGVDERTPVPLPVRVAVPHDREACGEHCGAAALPLARVRQVEHQQLLLVRWRRRLGLAVMDELQVPGCMHMPEHGAIEALVIAPGRKHLQPQAEGVLASQLVDIAAGARHAHDHVLHGAAPCSSSRASRRFSSQTGTPSSCALSSLEPAASPATTNEVFFDTEPATLAPSASRRCLASSRLSVGSVPVSTTVCPSSGAALASACGTAASSRWMAASASRRGARLASSARKASRLV